MNITSAGDGLLQAILEEPYTDDLRRIYADWLQEHDLWRPDAVLRRVRRHPKADGVRLLYANCAEDHGDGPRADFIRLQIELTFLEVGLTRPGPVEPCGPTGKVKYREGGFWYSDKSARGLLARARLLHDLHGKRWACGLPRVVKLSRDGDEDEYGCPWHFRRGFVDRVRLPIQLWLEHRADLARHHPLEYVESPDLVPLPRHVDTRPDTPAFRWAILPDDGPWADDRVIAGYCLHADWVDVPANPDGTARYLGYSSERAALDWLSERLIHRANRFVKEE